MAAARRWRTVASLSVAAVLVTAACSGPSASLAGTSTTATTVGETARSTDHFETLPPRSQLPSDAECASRGGPAPEVRPMNSTYNAAKGSGPPASPPAPLYRRVTGDFAGTTDEIIQWAACKWGIDED